MRARLAPLAAAAIALAAAGCGDDKVAPRGGAGGASTGPTEAPRPNIEETNRAADPGAVRVIRGWTDAQRASRIDRATSYFAVPAIVQNGAQPLRLATRPQVRFFNSTLPCGAVLVRTSASTQRGFTVATFRLVNRPGKQCDGTGAQARTAFQVRGGKIRAWLRIADRPQSPGAPAPPPSVPQPNSGSQSA
jgi:hypothetical protein